MSIEFSSEFKKRLEAHFEKRPEVGELVSQNIIKPHFAAHPRLHALIQSVARNRKENKLAAKLSRRSTKQELVDKGILLDTSEVTDGSLSMMLAKRQLTRQFDKHHLNEFLRLRPSLSQVLSGRPDLIEDTMTWTRCTTSGMVPYPRNVHTATVVQIKDNVPPRVYLLGGWGPQTSGWSSGGWGGSHSCVSSELLVLDTEALSFSRPMVGGVLPCDRYGHSCVAIGSNLVLFGGFSSADNAMLGDLHVLDTDFSAPFVPNFQVNKEEKTGNDAKVQTDGGGSDNENDGSSVEISPQSALSAQHPNLGGQQADPKAPVMQMLLWYQPREVKGKAPSPRCGHSAAVVDNRMYIFGGNDGMDVFNDMYCFDAEKMEWSEVSTSGIRPSPRSGHTCSVVDNRYLVIFGGRGVVATGGGDEDGIEQSFNDMHILDTRLMSWSQPLYRGTPPAARSGHTTTVLPSSKLLIFGGGFIGGARNDLHLFDIATGTWSRPSDSGDVPIPRAGHSCTAVGDELYVFGGGDLDIVYNDLYRLDTAFFLLKEFTSYEDNVLSPAKYADDSPGRKTPSKEDPNAKDNGKSSSKAKVEPKPQNRAPGILQRQSSGLSLRARQQVMAQCESSLEHVDYVSTSMLSHVNVLHQRLLTLDDQARQSDSDVLALMARYRTEREAEMKIMRESLSQLRNEMSSRLDELRWLLVAQMQSVIEVSEKEDDSEDQKTPKVGTNGGNTQEKGPVPTGTPAEAPKKENSARNQNAWKKNRRRVASIGAPGTEDRVASEHAHRRSPPLEPVPGGPTDDSKLNASSSKTKGRPNVTSVWTSGNRPAALRVKSPLPKNVSKSRNTVPASAKLSTPSSQPPNQRSRNADRQRKASGPVEGGWQVVSGRRAKR